MKFFSFAATFVVLFLLTYVFLAMVDALPEPRERAAVPEPQAVVAQEAELPVRVVSERIGLDSRIVHPASVDIDVLNKAVDEAAVHYPGSASLGQSGTVLLFGHSSHLPIVHNQVYKTFNGIEKLKEGETVSVYSGTTEYRYTVTSVQFAKAVSGTDDDRIPLPQDGKHLTLVTCDNFGVESDRWVVTAEFEGSYAL